MKKKILFMSALLCALVSFTACSNDDDNTPSEKQQLIGTWKLIDKGTMEGDGDNKVYTSAPIMMTWSAIDKSKPNMETIAGLATSMGSAILFNLLESVTFNEDGSITASYYTPLKDENIMDFAAGGNGPDDNGNISYSVVHKGNWSQAPKGLATWDAKSGYIYVTLNINAIIGATGSSNTEVSVEAITAFAKKYGIDADKLSTLLNTWSKEGIPLKYTLKGSDLSVYVDKELASPVIELLLPALPALQQMYENMPDSDTKSMISMMLLMMNGATSFNDIANIWNENTKDFGISLNFTKE